MQNYGYNARKVSPTTMGMETTKGFFHSTPNGPKSPQQQQTIQNKQSQSVNNTQANSNLRWRVKEKSENNKDNDEPVFGDYRKKK